MRASSELTNVSFWEKYWKNKSYMQSDTITKNYLFSDILNKYAPPIKKFTFLEIGGYPGYFSIYMAKYLGAESTLLDRYIDNKNIQKVMKLHNVDNIKTIECDLFEHNIETKYDMVMSAGFIEHFLDISDTIDKHLSFVKPGGRLIVTVPNFLGLNGYVQKKFDLNNYSIHNLDTMSKTKMLKIINSKPVKIKHMDYYGYFGLWLENIDDRPYLLRILIKAVGKLGKMLIRFDSKIFSPHFVIVLEKNK